MNRSYHIPYRVRWRYPGETQWYSHDGRYATKEDAEHERRSILNVHCCYTVEVFQLVPYGEENLNAEKGESDAAVQGAANS